MDKKKTAKTTKTATKAAKVAPKKVVKAKFSPKKEVTVVAPAEPVVEAKAKKVKVAEVNEVAPVEVKHEVVEAPKAEAIVAKKTTFNQDLNLVIGFLSLLTIIAFCFIFENASIESIGWEIVLNAADYSAVFKGIMILYVVTLFVDCILSIRVDTECELFNIIEKALYMFTLIMNVVTVSILISLISKIGIGLIMFLIISIVSAIIKLVRIFVK